mgnify:CR=1 FL=1
MKYFYCDSCFLITMYQKRCLDILSQYKEQFFIARSQIDAELLYPADLASLVEDSLTVIEETFEIRKKGNELKTAHSRLSIYDCLGLAFAIIDGYCLVTDDINLQKAAVKYGVLVKGTLEIFEEFGYRKEKKI